MNYIKELEIKLKDEWEKYLKSEGVIFPKGRKLYELICLFEHMPEAVSQDKILDWHNKHGFSYKRQARHLSDLGWDIRSGNPRFTRGIRDSSLKRNENRLHTIKFPNPVWSKDSTKRLNLLSTDDWNEILEIYKDRGCAVCGRNFEHYDKGHLSKKKPYEKGNIVPMCTECNNWGLEVEFKLYRDLVVRPIIKN